MESLTQDGPSERIIHRYGVIVIRGVNVTGLDLRLVNGKIMNYGERPIMLMWDYPHKPYVSSIGMSKLICRVIVHSFIHFPPMDENTLITY